jgi:predicted phosphate transport protein (TIGR00153 family)
MRLPLVPRERTFFALFDRQAERIVDGAAQLVDMLRNGGDDAELLERRKALRDAEHRGDEVTHEIVNLLNRTFVAPFDREDIYGLTSGLDDVLDYVDEVADTVVIYRIGEIPESAVRMAELIYAATKQLEAAVRKLESLKGLPEHWIEVHRLENEGDVVSRAAIGALFEPGNDPLYVVKLKDFYTLLEDGLDRCEDVANVIENIVIKHA